MSNRDIQTLGELRASDYQPQSVKEEIRNNLIRKIKSDEPIFEGILGFDETVIPDIERALLSRHNILLLGLRGQAKTRIARLMVNLLDQYIPVVSGSEMNDDPLQPLSRKAKDIIEEKGDDTPIEWVHRSNRYVEKLATPDVTVADLIGDVDPIKAATMKLPYSDERVIHFGLVPRAHRSIFVMNELPDLQARIQVSLFNILQEGDIQIRGFKLRLPLDIQFVFTANPEDYTQRGAIITPLKDRIESQILTHYPRTTDIARTITEQEAQLAEDQQSVIEIPPLLRELVEQITFAARESEYVDVESGVSARLSITAMENLTSAAERRMILNKEEQATARITDLWGVIPSITGKVELVYEGEQAGAQKVALELIEEAIDEVFYRLFPDPDESRSKDKDPYGTIRAWFSGGNTVELMNDSSEEDYRNALDSVSGLRKLVEEEIDDPGNEYIYMELLLHGLALTEVIEKNQVDQSMSFEDPLSDMLSGLDDDED